MRRIRLSTNGGDILREVKEGGPGIDEPLLRINASGEESQYQADGLGSIVR